MNHEGHSGSRMTLDNNSPCFVVRLWQQIIDEPTGDDDVPIMLQEQVQRILLHVLVENVVGAEQEDHSRRPTVRNAENVEKSMCARLSILKVAQFSRVHRQLYDFDGVYLREEETRDGGAGLYLHHVAAVWTCTYGRMEE